LAIDPDELALNLEEAAPEDLEADIETALKGLEDISGTAEAIEEEKVEPAGLSEERIEALITKTVEDVVERVVRETMVTVAEKVIKEAIDALKQTLESFEDRGSA
jgi:polygalacturonase